MARLYVLSGDDLGAVREVASGGVIGRGRDVEIPVRGASISRRHARLEEREGRWFVVDLGSSNGTRLGGRAVDEAPLEDGEEFLLGDVEVRFRVGVRASPPASATEPVEPERTTPNVETTYLPASASPAIEADGDELELEGDWDESLPAPAAPVPPPRPPAAPRESPARSGAETARRRAEAVGAPVGGARATTSGGRILQYQRVENRPGLFGADLAQLPAATRIGLYALVLAVVAALAWGAFRLAASAKRAAAPASIETELGGS